MRKLLAAFSAALTLLTADFPSEPVVQMGTDVNAQAAVVYQPDTEEILYELNADTKLPIASITKIMTALLTIENCKLDETVVFSKKIVYNIC